MRQSIGECCIRCGSDEWYLYKNRQCAVCAVERANHPGKKRLYRYGLAQEDYDSMLEAQGGGCALCGGSSRRLCVDHCHTTGKVRGILCGKCNTAIGALGDSEKALKKVVKYLLG